MKKKILFITILLSVGSFAQEKATDVFSVKAGFLGAWIGYEKAVSHSITINGEVGYVAGFAYSYSSTFGDELTYVFTTELNLEGWYYYNFKRRIKKGKNTDNNGANYLGLQMNYTPDWGTIISNNRQVNQQFTIYTNYGFRRNLS